jgi:hypothetical protein
MTAERLSRPVCVCINAAIAVAVWGAVFLLTGCERREPPQKVPTPSNEIARYAVSNSYGGIGEIGVVEFRDSAGRVCVYVSSSQNNGSLSCGYPREYTDPVPR